MYIDHWEIAICDDEVLILKQLKQMILQILERKSVSCHIQTFTSGEDLLTVASCFHMVFLDIEMPEIDGIEVGKKLRIRNPDCKIIMATGMIERFKECFQIEAFRFITKPFQIYELEEVFEAYALRFGMEKIEVYKNRQAYVFSQYEIQYIVSYDGYLEFQIKNTRFRSECSLQQMEALLDKRCFFRIHKQYIVNLYWIQDYKNDTLFLSNQKLPVSRRRKKAFEKAYMTFDLLYR